MKTLATVWDQIAVGRSHSVADTVAQRLKALELSRRAQSPGARRGRDGLKRVGRGARMRKLQRRQPKGDAKNRKGDPQGGKEPRKGKPGKGKDSPPAARSELGTSR